ncbi:hypothetical protein CHS0354_026177 [Potamilus streckersoni]|uniref:DUF7789 domain-containing protein n=1 Tax=Potamilus streckersoni TaxID=2493646 RepID=A0AAE0VTH7_9BIVA|nr:hypothetical protein CHS0354_026177 [Potamilus streckersoni]
MESESVHNESGDYSKYGITDVPKSTVITAFGKTKTFVWLSKKEWAFIILTTVNILAAVGLSVSRLVTAIKESPGNSDVTFAILLIINAVFVAFYCYHGVLRERKYELYVLVLAVIVVLAYCTVEYSINIKGHNTVKLVRLIIIWFLAPPNIILAVLVARDFGELEFRIAGASEYLQHIYDQAAIFSCWLKFDLQVTASFVVLALSDWTDVNILEQITLGVGIPYTFFWDIFGWITLRREIKPAAWIFAFFGLAKPTYYVYKIVDLYTHTVMKESPQSQDGHSIVVYCYLLAGALAFLTWLILMIELVLVYRNFGKGLKERDFKVLSERSSLLTGRPRRYVFSE